VFTPNTDPCDDSDACTTVDICLNGSCLSGPALDCDDNFICTDDSCDSIMGCENIDNNLCGACCLQNSSCDEDQTSASCDALGGTFVGEGEFCEGDTDGDGVVDACDICPGADDAVFGDCRNNIPTVSEWGLVIFALLLLVCSKVYYGRRAYAV